MIEGKIVKGIAGFYYVQTDTDELFECKAKGSFRNQKIKPFVGDNVRIEVIDEHEKKGNIVDILERRNELIRPAVTNVDQALIIFAATDPSPNLNLLDRFLILMERQKVDTIICFNKCDLVTKDEIEFLNHIYTSCGYNVIFTSTKNETKQDGMQQLIELLHHKTTVVAGPSGVGKSSIINEIYPDAQMETGVISEKIKRGKHTTRHSELFFIQENTYIMDTPGFSSLYLTGISEEELKEYFIEFREYDGECRFQGCAHINEPNCAVKDAVDSGKISEVRFRNYHELYQELKNQKKY